MTGATATATIQKVVRRITASPSNKDWNEGRGSHFGHIRNHSPHRLLRPQPLSSTMSFDSIALEHDSPARPVDPDESRRLHDLAAIGQIAVLRVYRRQHREP